MSDEPKYRDEEWLREQYVEKRRTQYEIAEECGCDQRSVSRWMKRHGIKTREGGKPVPDTRLTDEEWLREQYVEKRRTQYEIAEECGCHERSVSRWIKRHGIKTREGGTPVPDTRLTDEEWLREQYVEKGLTQSDIAEECDVSQTTIGTWLNKHGVDVDHNSPDDDRYRSKEWLREQYVEKGRTLSDIADECGVHQVTISCWKDKHGINVNHNLPDDDRYRSEEWLRKWCEEGKCPTEMAEICGVSTVAVHNSLNKHGIEAPDGRLRQDLSPLRDENWLREEYKYNRRSAPDIAHELDCDASVVQYWLDKNGIETRSSTEAKRPPADSPLLDAEYLEEKCSSWGGVAEVARECGVAPNVVRYWMSKADVEGPKKQVGVPVGEDHHRWRGGSRSYGRGWTDSKKRQVRERDGYECTDCGTTQAEHKAEYDQKLHVHHLIKARDIDDPEERNAPENLITLCRDCHQRWERLSEAGIRPQIDGVTAD